MVVVNPPPVAGATSMSEEQDELLKEILGIDSFDGNWVEEDVDRPVVSSNSRNSISPLPSATQKKLLPLPKYQLPPDIDSSDKETSAVFQFAYKCSGYCTPDGKVQRPFVRVIDLGPDRGNGLITTTDVPRGTVIYTERAAAAVQVPPANIRACDYCFRSLESADKLSATLPRQDLWPVPAIDFTTQHSSSTYQPPLNLNVDRYGRVQCKECSSYFCTQYCYKCFVAEYGSCCRMATISSFLETMDKDGSLVQAPVVLATRFLVHSLGYLRSHENNAMEGHFLEGICGSPEDMDALELGIQGEDGHCTLEPLYLYCVDLLEMTEPEQSILSLETFHRMAAQASRNGFGLRTQSPFKTYYESSVRKSMGRDSEEHKTNMLAVAQALGYDKIERGMDREIEEKVAPEICAIFPLTARCNHSCEPNAEVRSQEFIDHHMDLVAKRDLEKGEEILISYIGVGPNVGKKSTHQRQRELQRKYLFLCNCPKCTT